MYTGYQSLCDRTAIDIPGAVLDCAQSSPDGGKEEVASLEVDAAR
jgi:hypothetical protein